MNRHIARIALSSVIACSLLGAGAGSASAALKIAGPAPSAAEAAGQPAPEPAAPAAPLYASDIAPGTYAIDVASSASMFRVVDARLTVADDAMTCLITMSGSGYGKLFMGTAEQAEAAPESELIPFMETPEETHAFTVPVEALNVDTDCAAWSIRKQRWYDRVLVFESGRIPADAVFADAAELEARASLAADTAGEKANAAGPEGVSADPADASEASHMSADAPVADEGPGFPTEAMPDGTYLVSLTLEGGSGKASVVSPTQLVVENGTGILTVTWSSPHYTRMVVDGVEYPRVNEEGDSTFEIPTAVMEGRLAVSAETTAMGTPHMVDYTLVVGRWAAAAERAQAQEPVAEVPAEEASAAAASGQGAAPARESGASTLASRDTGLGLGWEPVESVPLAYARTFALDRYEGGYTLASLADGSRFFVVPEGAVVPEGLDADVTVLQQPLDDVYLVASNALCLVDALGAVGHVGVLGVKPEDVSVAAFSEALADGSIVYGGKYNAPDYELILAAGCPLAIESTMINHNPEVKEKLEALGVPVLTETSSREGSPLGRLEWIKLYGALFGAEEAADAIFAEQAALVESVEALEPTGKTVAFFYINSNGAAVTRRPGDYVAQMIELAGGTYAFDDLGGEGSGSTVTLEMEEFYARAKDADVIVYNATIDGGVGSLAELVAKNPLLADCKAVREGNVWCTDENMYQQMIATGQIIADIHAVLDGQQGELTYLYRLD